VLHPRLLEQYSYRARLTDEFQHAPSFPLEARKAHYDVILAAIAAGRVELLRVKPALMLNHCSAVCGPVAIVAGSPKKIHDRRRSRFPTARLAAATDSPTVGYCPDVWQEWIAEAR